MALRHALKAISSDYGSNKERNVHLEMRNLAKANRASETEEQRKERLRIRREKERKTKRISAWLFSKDCSGVMKMSWRENYWRQLRTAKETDDKRKTSLEKMVATELLKLAMETEEGRKERLKKMVANHSAEASP